MSLIHRLVSTADHIGSLCGKSESGDTIAANPFPLTCEECALLYRQLRAAEELASKPGDSSHAPKPESPQE